VRLEKEVERRVNELSLAQHEEHKLPDSLVLPSSHSTPPSVAVTPRRVHFRQPSASPTLYYSPAVSSAPSSPVLQFNTPSMVVQLEPLPPRLSHLPLSSTTAQRHLLNDLHTHDLHTHDLHKPLSSSSLPPPPSSLPPPLHPMNGHHSTDPSTHLTSFTSPNPSSPAFGSYFANSPIDFLADTSPPHPSSSSPPPPVEPLSTPAHSQPNGTEPTMAHAGEEEVQVGRAVVSGGGDRGQEGEAGVTSASLSDRVMGRIGGWMMGNKATPPRTLHSTSIE
jgi:hypothetical protein